jgi:thiol-disulfide isomerase/thioredoxin
MRHALFLSVLTLALAPTLAHGQSPTVPQMLAYKPVQPGISFSTPDAKDHERCKVELQRGQKANSSAWLLKDPQGRLLRRFADTNGDRYPDQWSYYKDGQEVYRETDSQFRNKPDRFNWLGVGGMRIGIDGNADGKIDRWEAISVEELSQEVVRAVATKDFSLIQPLLLTEPDLQHMGAPVAEVNRIREIQQKAPARFQETVQKLNQLNESTRWLHLETASPSRLLAETSGMKRDVLMHYRAMILCETAGKTEVVHLGEIVQVGEAWKLIDAPLTGDAAAANAVAQAPAVNPNEGVDPELQKLLKTLADLDAQTPQTQVQGPNPVQARYHLQRTDILMQVVQQAKDNEKATWFKQLADSLAAAAQASPPTDTTALQRLQQLAGRLSREQPGSEIAALLTYRALVLENLNAQVRAVKPEDMLTVQNRHQERMAQFVAQYPQAEDTPEALVQLGMMCEFQTKESDAQKWYAQLVQRFPQAKQAVRANGALKRMTLQGQPYEFSPQLASLSGGPFQPGQLRGKVVVVYYWASWCQYAANDFTKLRQYAQAYPGKLEIVAVNVDEDRANAERFLQQHNPAGVQLYASGGLDSPAAVQYGLAVFPHLFLLDGNGRVASKATDLVSLEAELKRLIK